MTDTPLRAFRSHLLRRFRGDLSGVSAVEFALVLPVMLGLLFGGNAVAEGVTISRKVTHVTSSLGDLVAQSRNITDTDMDNILDAAAAVMNPYDAMPLTIVVSGIQIDAQGKTKVIWSDARNRSALAVGATVALPTGLAQPSTFIVATEVHYPWKPTIGYVISGNFDFDDEAYLKPRLADQVTGITRKNL